MRMEKKSAEWVAVIRKCYPSGSKVVCDSMQDIHAVPSGTRGTVTGVDDVGTIHVDWENGSSLGLISGVDHFHIVGGE